MLKISIQGDNRKTMGVLEREKERIMSLIATDVKTVATRNTPIDKGGARRGWRLENTYREKRVVNRVPYVDLLEQGRSKQAPRGILGPTVREISRRRYK